MSSRRLPALVGLLVLVLGVAAVLLTSAADRRPVVPVRAGVPRSLPGDSVLTADVARAPLGRALALLRQDDAGTARSVLVGSDGLTARTLGDALHRNAPGDGGTPARSVLSPDGSLVVVGDQRPGSTRPDLALVDLRTGESSTVVVPDADGSESVVPMTWTPDRARVAGLVTAAAPDTTGAVVGRVVVVDVAARVAVMVPGIEGAVAAAFSPDGGRLAVQTGQRLLLLDPVTGEGAELGVPAGRTLAGGQAWSPDGSFLALTDGAGRLEFLPVLPDAVVPAPAEATGDVLGWLSATEVLHLDGNGAIARTDLSSGTSSTWTTLPAGSNGVALATGLVADAVAVPGGDVDRGPWPLPARLALVVLGSVLAVPATVGLRRRAGVVQQVVRIPEWARDSTLG